MVVLPGSLLNPFPPKSDVSASGREIARIAAAYHKVTRSFWSSQLFSVLRLTSLPVLFFVSTPFTREIESIPHFARNRFAKLS